MSEKIEKKEVIPSALKSPRFIIAAIIAFAIFIPFQSYRLYGCYGWGSNYATLILFLTALLYPLSKKFRLTPQEATLLFAVAGIVANNVSIYTAFYDCPLLGLPFIPIYGGGNLEKVQQWLPTWLMPPTDVLEMSRKGGVAFPFGPFLPALTFLSLFLIALLLYELSLAGLLARRWIEIERLPFPSFMPDLYLIKYYSEEGKFTGLLSFLKRPAYLIGFIIGFLISGIALMEAYTELATGKTYIQLPASTGFIGQFVVDLRFLEPYLPGAFLYWYPGLDFDFFPVALFLPLDVMATAIIWFFVWYILYPAVVNIMGIFPTKVTSGQLGGGAVGPFPFNFMGHTAVPVALAIYVFIFTWKYFKDFFVKAFKRKDLNPNLPETLPTYTLIGSFIVLLVLLSGIIGMPIFLAFLWLILFAFLRLGRARVAGEYFTVTLPYGFGTWRNGFMMMARGIYGWDNPQPSKDVWGTIMGMRLTHNAVERETGGVWSMIGWYRVARDTNTDFKSLFKAQFISIILAVVLAWPAVYAVGYFIGMDVSRSGYFTAYAIKRGARNFVNNGLAGTINPLSSWNTVQVGWFFGGIVLVLAMIFMRLRYPWFFLNPVGLLWQHPWWLGATMLAFVIKFLVIRIGGAGAYEKYIVPLAVGWAFGSALAALATYWPEQLHRALFNKVFAWFWW